MKMKFRGPATGQPFAVRVGTRSASVTEWGVRPAVAPSSGAALITLQAGSTTRLRPGLVLPFTDPAGRSGQFWVGGTLRGLTSGATATVLGYVHSDSGKGYLTLGDVVGSFAVGETLNGPLRKTFTERAEEDLAVVSAAGTPSFPKIGLLQVGTGAGRATTKLVLDGTLDVTGMPVGTYTIAEANTITGNFALVLAAPGKTATVATGTSGGLATRTVTIA